MTRRFRNLRPAKANAFKFTSSRRLLTAGYPATAATRVNFRETTIVWRCRFRLAAAHLTPMNIGDAQGSKSYRPFRPASRVACASLRRRELAQLTKAAAYRPGQTSTSPYLATSVFACYGRLTNRGQRPLPKKTFATAHGSFRTSLEDYFWAFFRAAQYAFILAAWAFFEAALQPRLVFCAVDGTTVDTSKMGFFGGRPRRLVAPP